MSHSKSPIFEEEELFLKVLIEGTASLYSYEHRNLKRYFYSKEGSSIEQLVFKEYLTPENKVKTNNQFKNQLWNNLKCSTITMKKIENLKYYKNNLTKLFIEYNKCNNPDFVSHKEKTKRDLFNLTLRPRFNSSSLTLENSKSSIGDVDFGTKTGFSFGIEAEYIFPFNNNKWSFIIEPTYQYFKSEKELDLQNTKIDYKSIEFPIGLRHYFFLNDDSKIFMNASYIIDFSRKGAIEYDLGADLDIGTSNNLAFGLGYKYNNKFSLELRHQTNRTVTKGYAFWTSKYSTSSLIFGYTIF